MLEFAKENPLVALLMTYAVCKTVRGVTYYYISHKYPLPPGETVPDTGVGVDAINA